uniref:C2H2-type domain-containing protein n=1 Tax=viral metagenome TaxID=1070528 RepID=A0A6C0HFY6_9ZZZZ
MPALKPDPKNADKFVCDVCDFKCSKHSNYLKHLATRKHKFLTNPNEKMPNSVADAFTCLCGKQYSHLSSLCTHRKKCSTIQCSTLQCNNTINNTINNTLQCSSIQLQSTTPTENMIISLLPPSIPLAVMSSVKTESEIAALTNLVIEVVKNNSEFQKQMLDMCKTMQSTIISNSNCNNTTNNNTTFNLQVFLNEYCKDAMNIGEFIDSFDLQISDLENVGRLGYIEGMSNIIINKIKELDVNKRPIHCSDLKREIIYIKDADIWEREDSNNTKFRKVIGKVMRKNIGKLSDWRDKYPDCMDIESEYNDIYVRLTKEAMGPNDTIDSENKIMKKIYKHLVIDKKALLAVEANAL